ncbi:MAG: Sua5/YciO/YrdC/YwlC family protein [Clostridiales bacterium]|nr:Sua5/YciO/YrdC/YwlC family protein [Clostridiales bacterium]
MNVEWRWRSTQSSGSGQEQVCEAVRVLKGGGVVALKGSGGYYLVCSPFDEGAVRKLREAKRREQKPFAVMFRDVAQVREFCVVGAQEEEALVGAQRPIVLVEGLPADGTGQPEGLDLEASRGLRRVRRGSAERLATASQSSASASLSETPCSASRLRRSTQSPGSEPQGEASMHQGRRFAEGVCNTSRLVGAFLPAFEVQRLLVEELGPLIMTSANVSALPIITDDGDMLCMVGGVTGGGIDGVLYHERPIEGGVDDSVVRVVDRSVQIIRRSKGYVPAPVFAPAASGLDEDVMIFAAGGHLKSVFAFSKGAHSYLSRHIGDLGSLESEAAYCEAFERMKKFLGVEPGLAVCDMHPRYYTTQFAEGLGVPVLYVQHHHAHVASVMAEHGLRGPVIGVSFDGTGYGTDGAVWGGEVLVCEGPGFERFSHLGYVEMLGGDESMRDAWKAGVAVRRSFGARDTWQHEALDLGAGRPEGVSGEAIPLEADEEALRRVRRGATERLATSSQSSASASLSETPCSASRLRHSTQSPNSAPQDTELRAALVSQDADGAFEIDLGGVIAYAERWRTMEFDGDERYDVQAVGAALEAGVNTVKSSSMGRLFDAVAALLGIHYENRYEGECAIMLENAAHRAVEKERDGEMPTEQERLALAFHMGVAQAVLGQCRRARDERSINVACLSGGVFQNKLLMEEALRLLREDGFDVYCNIQAPPNDGGIALGQNYVGMLESVKGA